jgi:hypothetical protein
MGRGIQRGLVVFLTIALIVGGFPLAHAMPQASAPHMHHDAMQDDAVHHDMTSPEAMHHHAMAAEQRAPQRDRDDHAAGDPCNCLDCNMCTTPGVMPMIRDLQVGRRILAVSYRSSLVTPRSAWIFVDPGIPILRT